MKKRNLRNISFFTYIKMIIISSLGTGLMLGLICLIGVVLGFPVSVDGQVVDYWAGVQSGLLIAGSFTVAWGVVPVIFCTIMFPALCLFLRITKGISFEATFDEPPKNNAETEED